MGQELNQITPGERIGVAMALAKVGADLYRAENFWVTPGKLDPLWQQICVAEDVIIKNLNCEFKKLFQIPDGVEFLDVIQVGCFLKYGRDDIFDEILDLIKNDEITSAQVGRDEAVVLLSLSAGFLCFAASTFLHIDKRENAWESISEAKYQLGKAGTYDKLDVVKLVASIQSVRGKKGGSNKAETYKTIQSKALDLAKELRKNYPGDKRFNKGNGIYREIESRLTNYCVAESKPVPSQKKVLSWINAALKENAL